MFSMVRQTKFASNEFLFRVFILLFLIATCRCCQASTNFVTRVIRYENGDVLVEDHLYLPAERYRDTHSLSLVARTHEKGSTNFLPALKAMLEGEDLEIQRFEVNQKDKFIDLRVTSWVKPGIPLPAKMQLVAAYPTLLPLDPDLPKRPELLMYSIESNNVLWLPEWPNGEKPSDVVFELLNSDYLATKWSPEKTDLRIQCLLKTDEGTEILFDYSPESGVPNAPSAEFVERLNKEHKISGNHLRRIFTKFKLGKPGYYAISTSGFTNKPPIFPEGQTNFHFQPRPLTEDELDEFRSNNAYQHPETTLNIDGSAADWKIYKTAWKVIDSGSSNDDLVNQMFHIVELDYCNDSNFLYLFFRFKPTMQERSDQLKKSQKFGTLGNIAFLYLGSQHTNGSQLQRRQFGDGDLQISVLAGMRVHVSSKTNSSSAEVSYSIDEWDKLDRRFGHNLMRSTSGEKKPLINHGEDGVEMAIPLSEIKKTNGMNMEMICEEDLPQPRYRQIMILLE
jgi:hypothetical protein